MPIYKKWNAAFEKMDVDACSELLHRDYTFVRHQSNTTVSRDDWISMAEGLFEAMRNGKMEILSSRCIYENEDILVQHDVMAFPDGSKEAVMGVHNLKDGKLFKSETGATPIK